MAFNVLTGELQRHKEPAPRAVLYVFTNELLRLKRLVRTERQTEGGKLRSALALPAPQCGVAGRRERPPR